MLPLIGFWISAFLIAYTYFGYYLILLIWHQAQRKNRSVPEDHVPLVSMVISAYNEEDVIADKIRNCTEIDYPRDRIEFIFGTDGCSDATAEILKQSEEVQVVSFARRSGKANVLNRIVPRAKGEIICFSDANTLYRPDAIQKLVRHLSNPRIGGVCGNLLLIDRENPSAEKGEAQYWQYENRIKQLEGDIRTVFGASGGIYVVRKHLFHPLPGDRMVNDDFLIAMRVVQQGYDMVYEADAMAREVTSGDIRSEFKRKARIGAANFEVLPLIADLLHPKKGFVAFGLWSHKIIRWLVPFLLFITLISSTFLLDHPFYYWIFIAQLIFYMVALIGYLAEKSFSLPSFILYPYYLTAVNLALGVGFCRFLFRLQKPTWQRSKRN